MKLLTFPSLNELNIYGYSDLSLALANNEVMASDSIREVLAYVPGYHDGAAYHWLVRLHNYNLAYITGGCDYTGWDCHSSVVIREMEKFDPLAIEPYDNDMRPVRDLICFQYQYIHDMGHPEQVLNKLIFDLPSEKQVVFREASNLLRHLNMQIAEDVLIYTFNSNEY